jgi:hypothetical protein
MPRSSMTSFAVAIEPPPGARLAVFACALHLGAAASAWFARVPPVPATALSLAALAGLAWTLAAVPGRHHRLAGLANDGQGWRVRLRDADQWTAAEMGTGSRAYRGFVFLEIRANGRCQAWFLTRAAVPADAFRRLKARIRLTC